MPHIVRGKRFHEYNLPGPKLAPDCHHEVRAPITVSVEGATEGAARYKAEHLLAEEVGDADEVICTETVFGDAKLGMACTMTGVPIKYLAA